MEEAVVAVVAQIIVYRLGKRHKTLIVRFFEKHGLAIEGVRADEGTFPLLNAPAGFSFAEKLSSERRAYTK
ncbi:uncharacterized protein Bfra_002846 [Botrytis fragariae]|uniref:Uncharacterized protein n=1 Tax=Botrytis fragariae TaxID=1964551 RepID=A0A8H6AZF5_9HELO|nr:uncharacterized protein Bfra_002846 [Botrytis fragariae]KAF5876441.1 hypothetical protein Bfra_002846 [Botrytis fragariae]